MSKFDYYYFIKELKMGCCVNKENNGVNIIFIKI